MLLTKVPFLLPRSCTVQLVALRTRRRSAGATGRHLRENTVRRRSSGPPKGARQSAEPSSSAHRDTGSGVREAMVSIHYRTACASRTPQLYAHPLEALARGRLKSPHRDRLAPGRTSAKTIRRLHGDRGMRQNRIYANFDPRAPRRLCPMPAQTPMRLRVDATDAPRRLFHVQMTMPAKPGPLTLLYPEWIPGEHGPTGPIVQPGRPESAGRRPDHRLEARQREHVSPSTWTCPRA